MKHLKLGIVACGAVALVLLLTNHFVDYVKADTANMLMVVAGLVAPIAVGGLGIAKPPFLQWQAIVATAGFALVVVKARLWTSLPHIADLPARDVVMHVALVAGLVISVLAIAKPEDVA